MLDLVVSELECAVEFFIEEDDLSETAIQHFMQTKVRAIKVEYPHVNPKLISRECARIMKELIGR